MIKKLIKWSSAGAVLTCLLLNSCNTSTSNAEKPKTDTVIIDQMKFTPATITINKGDTVLFINNGIVAHNATEVNKTWASPTLNNGDSWKVAPDKSAEYYCSIHIVMKGKIVVK